MIAIIQLARRDTSSETLIFFKLRAIEEETRFVKMNEIFLGLLEEAVKLILLNSLDHAIELHFAEGIDLFKQLLLLEIEFGNLAIEVTLASLIFCSCIFKILNGIKVEG